MHVAGLGNLARKHAKRNDDGAAADEDDHDDDMVMTN